MILLGQLDRQASSNQRGSGAVGRHEADVGVDVFCEGEGRGKCLKLREGKCGRFLARDKRGARAPNFSVRARAAHRAYEYRL